MKVRLKLTALLFPTTFFIKINDYVCSTTNSTPSNIVAFNFLLIAFLTGIASAFQTPTLSLYLSQEIQVSPFCGLILLSECHYWHYLEPNSGEIF